MTPPSPRRIPLTATDVRIGAARARQGACDAARTRGRGLCRGGEGIRGTGIRRGPLRTCIEGAQREGGGHGVAEGGGGRTRHEDRPQRQTALPPPTDGSGGGPVQTVIVCVSGARPGQRPVDQGLCLRNPLSFGAHHPNPPTPTRHTPFAQEPNHGWEAHWRYTCRCRSLRPAPPPPRGVCGGALLLSIGQAVGGGGGQSAQTDGSMLRANPPVKCLGHAVRRIEGT